MQTDSTIINQQAETTKQFQPASWSNHQPASWSNQLASWFNHQPASSSNNQLSWFNHQPASWLGQSSTSKLVQSSTSKLVQSSTKLVQSSTSKLAGSIINQQAGPIINQQLVQSSTSKLVQSWTTLLESNKLQQHIFRFTIGDGILQGEQVSMLWLFRGDSAQVALRHREVFRNSNDSRAVKGSRSVFEDLGLQPFDGVPVDWHLWRCAPLRPQSEDLFTLGT